MHPLLVIAIPWVLVVIDLILKQRRSFDQSPSLIERDASQRLVAERETYRQFFDRQIPS